MPISSTKRSLIAVAILMCLLIAGAMLALHRLHRQSQLPPISAIRFPAKAPPDTLSQLPPQAPMIGYADVKTLRNLPDSPLKVLLGLASSDPNADREYKAFVRDTGFDYTRDLDKVSMSYWPTSVAATPSGIEQNRALAIADGRFDHQKINAYALRSGKVVTRGAQSVYEIPGNPPVSFEFLSPTRMALASGRNAESLLPNSNSPASSAREPAMQALIDRVSGAPVFAVVRTEALPNTFYSSLSNSPQLAQFARSVKDLSLAGAPQGKELQVALDAECDSIKNAFEIATLLETSRMFGSMALEDPKMRTQMTKEQAEALAALIREAKITHDGVWVRINLAITAEMTRLLASR
jgi:hypothetical protein